MVFTMLCNIIFCTNVAKHQLIHGVIYFVNITSDLFNIVNVFVYDYLLYNREYVHLYQLLCQ